VRADVLPCCAGVQVIRFATLSYSD